MASSIINIGLDPEVRGELKFVATTMIGPLIAIDLPDVQFGPTGGLNFIGDAYGLIELTGEILADPSTGSFGTVTHPDGTIVAPNILSYYVGTGIVTWKAVGASTFTDLGNVDVFEVSPTVTRLDHWNHRVGGIRKKDFAPVVQQACTCRITMDEFNAANLQMAFLGTVTAGP